MIGTQAVPSRPPRAVILRTWLVILALCVLLSPSVAMAGANAAAHAGESGREGPSIGSDREPFSGDFRVAEGLQLLTTVGRILVDGTSGLQALAHRGSKASAPQESPAGRWCDVVQCRRQSGVQLLRYATPPPARG